MQSLTHPYALTLYAIDQHERSEGKPATVEALAKILRARFCVSIGKDRLTQMLECVSRYGKVCNQMDRDIVRWGFTDTGREFYCGQMRDKICSPAPTAILRTEWQEVAALCLSLIREQSRSGRGMTESQLAACLSERWKIPVRNEVSAGIFHKLAQAGAVRERGTNHWTTSIEQQMSR